MDITNKKNILDFIRTVPNYPKEGINFYDINSLFASNIFVDVMWDLSQAVSNFTNDATHIAGVESRGFVIGSTIAYELGLPFVMIRKEHSKYPGNLHSESYELEYGSNTLVLQEGLIGHTSRIVLVDDLIATGGTAEAAAKIVNISGGKVAGFIFVINLFDLPGNDLLKKKGYKTESLIEFPGH